MSVTGQNTYFLNRSALTSHHFEKSSPCLLPSHYDRTQYLDYWTNRIESNLRSDVRILSTLAVSVGYRPSIRLSSSSLPFPPIHANSTSSPLTPLHSLKHLLHIPMPRLQTNHKRHRRTARQSIISVQLDRLSMYLAEIEGPEETGDIQS